MAVRRSDAGHCGLPDDVRSSRLCISGGSNAYPLAELGLSHGYAAIGDKLNSNLTYQRFKTDPKEAEPVQPLH